MIGHSNLRFRSLTLRLHLPHIHDIFPIFCHIGIVITDQTSTDTEATKREAEQAKNDGIHLLSVGIGNGINPRELQTLSSGERFISRVSSFDGLEALMPQVRQLICEGM